MIKCASWHFIQLYARHGVKIPSLTKNICIRAIKTTNVCIADLFLIGLFINFFFVRELVTTVKALPILFCFACLLIRSGISADFVVVSAHHVAGIVWRKTLCLRVQTCFMAQLINIWIINKVLMCLPVLNY